MTACASAPASWATPPRAACRASRLSCSVVGAAAVMRSGGSRMRDAFVHDAVFGLVDLLVVDRDVTREPWELRERIARQLQLRLDVDEEARPARAQLAF